MSEELVLVSHRYSEETSKFYEVPSVTVAISEGDYLEGKIGDGVDIDAEFEEIVDESDVRSNSRINKSSDVFTSDYYRNSRIFGQTFESPIDALQDGTKIDWIEPPYDPFEYSFIYECDTRVAKTTLLRARNVCANGWSIKYIKPEEEFTAAEKKIADKQKSKLEYFFLNSIYDTDDVNDTKKSDIEECLQRMVVDKESTGIGYICTKRDEQSDLESIKHEQAVWIRKRKLQNDSNPGYVKLEYKDGYNGFVVRKYYYKCFGDNRVLDKNTGVFHPEGTQLAESDIADELIEFKLYAPGIMKYGIPRYTSAKFAIQGNFYSNVQNISLLKNDATPRMAVLVENGHMDTDTISRLESYFNVSNRGPAQEGRVLVLQGEKKKPSLPGAQEKPTKIVIQPLSLGVIDEGSFPRLREKNDAEKAEISGTPGIFLGSVEGSGKAASASVLKLYFQQEITPDRKEINKVINKNLTPEIINQTIKVNLSDRRNLQYFAKYSDEDIEIQKDFDFDKRVKILKNRMFELGFIFKGMDGDIQEGATVTFQTKTFVKFVLNEPEMVDPLEEARINRLHQDLASVTPNDIKRQQGQKEYENSELWANRPLPVIEQMLKAFVPTEVVFGPKYKAKPPPVAAGGGFPSKAPMSTVKKPVAKPKVKPAASAPKKKVK